MSNEHVAPVMEDAEPRTKLVTDDLGLTVEALAKDVHCQRPTWHAKSMHTVTEEPVKNTRCSSSSRRRCRCSRRRSSSSCCATSTAARRDTQRERRPNRLTVPIGHKDRIG